MKAIKIIFLLTIISLISCEDSEIDSIPEARVVVKALLHADQPIDIHISKEILFKREENDNTFYLEGLEVTMSDDEGSFILNDDGNGNYSSTKLVDTDYTYSLSFTYNDENINSSTSVPSKPEDYTSSRSLIKIEPFTGGRPPTVSQETVELNWTNSDQSYYIVVVTNLEDEPEPINTSGFSRPTFRSEPEISDNYDIGSADFQYYGMHSMILYKVTPEYAALYEDPGDNSLTIKTPYSNIKNGLGIFTAVNSDTLYINVYH